MVSVATQDARSEDSEMVLKSRTLPISKPGVKGQGKREEESVSEKIGLQRRVHCGEMILSVPKNKTEGCN